MRPLVTAMVGLALVLASTSHATAVELKVLAGGSLTEVLGAVALPFQRATGHTIVVRYGSTPQLTGLVKDGTPFDLGIVPAELFRDGLARVRFAPRAVVDIARVGYGVAVRAGVAKPDVSSPETLKRALLDAGSVALVPESAAGAHVLRTFERLGILDTMTSKIKAQAAPARIAPAVATGEAEMGVFLVNVLIAPGVELAGLFPAELQQELVFSAAVAAGSPNQTAAQALIDYLRGAAGLEVIRSKGMNPG